MTEVMATGQLALARAVGTRSECLVAVDCLAESVIAGWLAPCQLPKAVQLTDVGLLAVAPGLPFTCSYTGPPLGNIKYPF